MATSVSPVKLQRMKKYVVKLKLVLSENAKGYEDKVPKLEQNAQHFMERSGSGE